MEGGLEPIAAWIGAGDDAIPVIDEASVSLVRERVREEGARVGLQEVAAAAMVNVGSELAHNQLAHARHGLIVVREVPHPDGRGLEIVAADRGGGISDVRRALEGRPSRRGSLGVGLAAVSELADEVDFDVRLGEGTCVWARKLPKGAARRRRVGVYGRAYPGEPASGDDAAFVRTGDGLLACVADGLGHGVPAREAAARAVRMALTTTWRAPAALLAACDGALARTRGAVMAAVRVGASGEVIAAGVGNVSLHGYGYAGGWRFGGSSFVLGAPGGARRIAEETHTLAHGDALVLFTDGVRSRLDLSGQFDLLREHPIVIAEHVVDQFGRDDDDVLVMVIA